MEIEEKGFTIYDMSWSSMSDNYFAYTSRGKSQSPQGNFSQDRRNQQTLKVASIGKNEVGIVDFNGGNRVFWSEKNNLIYVMKFHDITITNLTRYNTTSWEHIDTKMLMSTEILSSFLALNKEETLLAYHSFGQGLNIVNTESNMIVDKVPYNRSYINNHQSIVWSGNADYLAVKLYYYSNVNLTNRSDWIVIYNTNTWDIIFQTEASSRAGGLAWWNEKLLYTDWEESTTEIHLVDIINQESTIIYSFEGGNYYFTSVYNDFMFLASVGKKICVYDLLENSMAYKHEFQMIEELTYMKWINTGTKFLLRYDDYYESSYLLVYSIEGIEEYRSTQLSKTNLYIPRILFVVVIVVIVMVGFGILNYKKYMTS